MRRLTLHRRADEIRLISLIQMLFDITEGPLPYRAVDEVGADGPAAGGQLIDDRDLQVAVDDHGQGAGDGGGGHDQHMGVLSLLPQGGPLLHPEPVLLIGDDQPQIRKGGVIGEEGVGADAEVDLPGGKGGL